MGDSNPGTASSGTASRWWTNNAWGDGYCDAAAWCEDNEPTLDVIANEAVTLPALDDEWLVLYQSGWCAGIEAWLNDGSEQSPSNAAGGRP